MKRMKPQLNGILIFAFLFITSSVFAQNEQSKNTIALSAGVEWNTISGVVAMDLERQVFSQDKVALGIRGSWIFRHEQGNMSIFFKPNEGTASMGLLMGTAHYYTAKKFTDNRGFFLQGGLGAVLRMEKLRNQVDYNQVLPALDLGFGSEWKLVNKTRLRWTTGMCFAGRGGITYTKIGMAF